MQANQSTSHPKGLYVLFATEFWERLFSDESWSIFYYFFLEVVLVDWICLEDAVSDCWPIFWLHRRNIIFSPPIQIVNFILRIKESRHVLISIHLYLPFRTRFGCTGCESMMSILFLIGCLAIKVEAGGVGLQIVIHFDAICAQGML